MSSALNNVPFDFDKSTKDDFKKFDFLGKKDQQVFSGVLKEKRVNPAVFQRLGKSVPPAGIVVVAPCPAALARFKAEGAAVAPVCQAVAQRFQPVMEGSVVAVPRAERAAALTTEQKIEKRVQQVYSERITPEQAASVLRDLTFEEKLIEELICKFLQRPLDENELESLRKLCVLADARAYTVTNKADAQVLIDSRRLAALQKRRIAAMDTAGALKYFSERGIIDSGEDGWVLRHTTKPSEESGFCVLQCRMEKGKLIQVYLDRV